MKIESTERLCQCAKPGCTGTYTHRHHMGCETMWIRAFASKRRSKKYKAFLRRYMQYRKTDVIEICERHHEEAHWLYGAVITREIRKRHFKLLKNYTWQEAEEMMQVLRKFCKVWLEKETPGRNLEKFAR